MGGGGGGGGRALIVFVRGSGADEKNRPVPQGSITPLAGTAGLQCVPFAVH